MKRILVPTDFSPTAEKAFRFAVDIASRSGGSVTLYHVYTPVESLFVGTDKTRKQYNRESEVILLKQLHRLRNNVVTDYPNAVVATVLGEGAAVDKILNFTTEENYDLVVMGTQGATGLKENIIGSVAARVIEKSKIPVLLIPEKYDWSEPSRIVFATNYQASDKDVLPKVLDMASLYNARVMVVHLYDLYEMEEEKERKNFDDYANMLRKGSNNENLEFRFLKVSSVREAMETLDRIVPYDILVMVSRRKTFLERFFVNSFTQNMAYLNTLPLLVLQDTGK